MRRYRVWLGGCLIVLGSALAARPAIPADSASAGVVAVATPDISKAAAGASPDYRDGFVDGFRAREAMDRWRFAPQHYRRWRQDPSSDRFGYRYRWRDRYSYWREGPGGWPRDRGYAPRDERFPEYGRRRHNDWDRARPYYGGERYRDDWRAREVQGSGLPSFRPRGAWEERRW